MKSEPHFPAWIQAGIVSALTHRYFIHLSAPSALGFDKSFVSLSNLCLGGSSTVPRVPFGAVGVPGMGAAASQAPAAHRVYPTGCIQVCLCVLQGAGG